MKTQYIVTAFILTMIFLFVPGCGKSTEPSQSTAHYPLAAGNEWNYSMQYHLTNFQPTVPGAVFHDTTIQWTIRVQCTGRDTTQDSIAGWRLHSTDTYYNPGTADYIYAFKGDTLRLIATEGYGTDIMPKESPGIEYRLGNRTYQSIRQLHDAVFPDGITGFRPSADNPLIEEYPRNVLVFPLRVGQQWDYLPPVHDPFGIVKEVVGYGAVTGSQLSYQAFKIRWKWIGFTDSTLTQYDYVSSAGLVQREMYAHALLSNLQHPDGIGEIDIHSVCSATSITLH